MKLRSLLSACLLAGLGLLSSCSHRGTSVSIVTIDDLPGKRMAYLSGSAYEQILSPFVSGVKYYTFNDITSEIQALRSGKVDGVFEDLPVVKLYTSMYSEDLAASEVFVATPYAYALAKGSPLTDKVSAVIRALKTDGTLDEIIDRWTGPDAGSQSIPEWNHRDFRGANGTLIYGSDPIMEPACYLREGGEYVGFEIEIARRIAYELDMEFQFVTLNFDGLIEALNAGKVNMIGSCLSITKERREVVDFAESHYTGGLAAISLKNRTFDVIDSVSQIVNQRMGMLVGSCYDKTVRQAFPDAKYVYYKNVADLPVALLSGKIDAFLYDEPTAIMMMGATPGLKMLPADVDSVELGFMFPKSKKELCDAFTREILLLREAGETKRLEEKWFDVEDKGQEVTLASETAPKGVLRYAMIADNPPFSYIRDGKPAGYDIEIITLIGEKLGYRPEPIIVDFGGLLELVNSGRVDAAVGGITITEERRQKIDFCHPTYTGGLVVIVASSDLKAKLPEAPPFWQSLKDSFERTFVREDRWRLVVSGLDVTLKITVLSTLLGTLLAVGVCALRRSKKRIAVNTAKVYIALMQGMPILVILMILYYVVFAKININAVLVAVIGFSLNFAAYVGEMFRTGIDSIPRGQNEAALALGFNKLTAFRKVIAPQVIRRVMPVYRGEFVSMLKMTSVVGYIAIQDLTKMSDIIRSRTYEAFFPLIATAIVYFAAAQLLALVLMYVEKRLDPVYRRSKGGKK